MIDPPLALPGSGTRPARSRWRPRACRPTSGALRTLERRRRAPRRRRTRRRGLAGRGVSAASTAIRIRQTSPPVLLSRSSRSSVSVPISEPLITPGARRYGFQARKARPPVPGRGRCRAARPLYDLRGDPSSTPRLDPVPPAAKPAAREQGFWTRFGPRCRSWPVGAKKSGGRRAQNTARIQPLYEMARPGIEPGTPRLSGSRDASDEPPETAGHAVSPLCFYPRMRLDAGGFRTLWAARVQNALGVMRPISRTVRPLIGPVPGDRSSWISSAHRALRRPPPRQVRSDGLGAGKRPSRQHFDA